MANAIQLVGRHSKPCHVMWMWYEVIQFLVDFCLADCHDTLMNRNWLWFSVVVRTIVWKLSQHFDSYVYSLLFFVSAVRFNCEPAIGCPFAAKLMCAHEIDDDVVGYQLIELYKLVERNRRCQTMHTQTMCVLAGMMLWWLLWPTRSFSCFSRQIAVPSPKKKMSIAAFDFFLLFFCIYERSIEIRWEKRSPIFPRSDLLIS